MGIEIRDYAVEVFALNMLLHGHVQSGRRLTDMVNESEPYIALDDVHIFPYQPDAMLGLGERSHSTVNQASIVLITVAKEVVDATRGQCKVVVLDIALAGADPALVEVDLLDHGHLEVDVAGTVKHAGRKEVVVCGDRSG